MPPHAVPRGLQVAVGLAAIGLVAIVTAGCSGGSPDVPRPAADATATAGASGTDRSMPDSTPTRTTTFRAPGGGAGNIEVGLVGLKVDGRLATLTLLWTPRYTDPPRSAEISLFDMFGARSPAVSLVDSVNLKRYVVVQDSRNVELGASGPRTRTTNNTPVSASYTFAAPPADVRTIDVYADDRLLFDDAPITR